MARVVWRKESTASTAMNTPLTIPTGYTPGPWQLSPCGQHILGPQISEDEQPVVCSVFGAACDDQGGSSNEQTENRERGGVR